MPDFAYTARDAAGQEVIGTIVAATQREAVGRLGQQALFPVHIEPEKTTKAFWKRRKKVSAQALSSMLSQMGDLLQSGVPLMRSLEVLARQASNEDFQEVIEDVRSQVADGVSLHEAMAQHQADFGELTVSMVQAGAEGGFLEDVLKRTADFVEQQEDLKARVIGAVTYPALLAIAGFSATTVLIVFFVPKFAELFARLEEQGELPILTVGLLATSDFLGKYGLIFAAVIVGLGVWLSNYLGTPNGRMQWDRWRLRIPLAGEVFLSLAVARFCRVLGTLLNNGVPILRSLEISSNSTGNRVLAIAIQNAAENISSGQSLARPLAACGLFPQTVVEMISVAEESNNLEVVLINIADSLDRRTQRKLDLVVRLLEPLMLLVMAVIILMLVIALLLPVFQMSATVG